MLAPHTVVRCGAVMERGARHARLRSTTFGQAGGWEGRWEHTQASPEQLQISRQAGQVQVGSCSTSFRFSPAGGADRQGHEHCYAELLRLSTAQARAGHAPKRVHKQLPQMTPA